LWWVFNSNKTEMWLPLELAMQIGSYLHPLDLTACTTQLCSSGAGFVATELTNGTTTIRLQELVACCRLSPGVDDVAQECMKRIKSFVARRGNVRTIVLNAQLKRQGANASVYSEFHRRLQQGSSFQLSQSQGITVEWHVTAASIAQVAFLLTVDVPNDGACVSDSSASGAIRQYVHTLNLSYAEVSDMSALVSCKSLHTLYIVGTQVNDVSALSSCQSLHTLDLSETEVIDVSGLACCQSLHTLNLRFTQVRNVSALASCQSLHTLNLNHTQMSDVSALVSCQSLHTLYLSGTQVSDASVLASCQSLHTLNLRHTQVSDVSALASCQSLRNLCGVERMIGGTDVVRVISGRGEQ
jgi:hypothetical protein